MELQLKYSSSKIEYLNLEKLKFSIIRKKDDNFFKINDNTKIRRNFPWHTESPNQSTLFDLKNLCLLSRVHIIGQRIMKVKVEIAENEIGPYVKIDSELTVISGGIRVIKIGSLPCRYLRITILKGHTIMDFTKVECYGLALENIRDKYDEDTLDLLFYNSYDLIYRKQDEEEDRSRGTSNI
jgi:hypothetical protein